ncbi:endonuclease/exonuclease/phosphatase family protein [Priestia taiwanensis]|uniref:Endonuclease n=1 Tax=Priestia taiwanensis TaxID=1347902 RepID=A0A917AWK9_9BACI|nr:endonuclease/exonuclease/phosphatase family protein [Priestia taiwanensis]MBM7364922.1 endonuclease/exonuclease/phosphatase family metal-dependent hydrolase [Priestia taiwanensis]GGE82544.1 endonuclease [Priestia taiwanensis]
MKRGNEKSILKTILLSCLGFILFVGLAIGGFILYMVMTDYKPQSVEEVTIENNQKKVIQAGEELTGITFNIGYGGLDESRDFFEDGGEMSRSESKEKTEENMKHIGEYLKQADPSFALLQEIDVDSYRSFHVNEVKYLQDILTSHSSVFGLNYKVPWVPVPVFDPMGGAHSGVLTFSKYEMEKATRYALPGQENWLRQLFELDRAMVVHRLPVDNGKELVLINAHFSAYDKGGEVRKQQMAYAKEFIEKEYKDGNYVVIGGDWNQLFPGTNVDSLNNKKVAELPSWLQILPEDFLPEGFQWGSDVTVPTSRNLDTPYKKGETFVSVIDGFAVSPNVEITESKGIDLDFQHSDHNPVQITFKLK